MQVNFANLIAAQSLRPAQGPSASHGAASSSLKAAEAAAPAAADSVANATAENMLVGPARVRLGAKIDIRV
jgi:hypothetical protein